MSRDCTDQVIGNELVQISVELVERAEILETYFSISGPRTDPDDLFVADVTDADEDDKD
jgi:hypothetical protein